MSKKNKKAGKYRKSSSTVSKRLGIGVLAAVIVLIGALIIVVANRNGANEGPVTPTDAFHQISEEIFTTEGTTPPSEETTKPSEETETTAPAETTETTAPSQTTAPAETEPKETTKPAETEELKPTTPPPTTQPTTPTTEAKEPTQAQPVVPPTIPPETEPPKTVIRLPYTIPGTSLTIHRVANYSGIYLEDGSDTDAGNIAMMLLENTGSQAVEFAKLTLTYDDKTLVFNLSALGAGDRVVVQEANRAGCANGDLTNCGVDIALRDTLEMSATDVSVVDNGDNTLTVTNLTAEAIVTIRVFYKYYMRDEDAYVGGITYTAKISNLKAGESITITPSHYSSEASSVVMVRTYDTDT